MSIFHHHSQAPAVGHDGLLPDEAQRAVGTLRSLDPFRRTAVAEALLTQLPPQSKQELVPRMAEGLGESERRAVAEGVVAQLPAQDKQELVPHVARQLGNSEKRAAAEGVVAQMPPDERQDLVPSLVKDLENSQKQAVVADVAGQLTNEERQEVAEGLGLPPPDVITRRYLWYMVVGILGVAIFVFGSMAFTLLAQKQPAEAPLTLATTALGAVVGLIAFGPGNRKQG